VKNLNHNMMHHEKRIEYWREYILKFGFSNQNYLEEKKTAENIINDEKFLLEVSERHLVLTRIPTSSLFFNDEVCEENPKKPTFRLKMCFQRNQKQ
jgi:hypothetical protein